jgi:hypothetical protein
MTDQDVSRLSGLLAESYASTLSIVEKIGFDLQIYDDPVWRARDVIWHLAVWDRQVTRSIEAFLAGGQYSIPDFDEHAFNDTSLEEGRQLSLEQLQEDAAQARKNFQDAVERFSPHQLQAEFLYPWGDETGVIDQLVHYMVDHDEEHRQELTSAQPEA